jgi:hypothetical protein
MGSTPDVTERSTDVRESHLVAPERGVAKAQRDVVGLFFAVCCHVSMYVARAERAFTVQTQPILSAVVARMTGSFERISREALVDPVQIEMLDVRAIGLGLHCEHDIFSMRSNISVGDAGYTERQMD